MSKRKAEPVNPVVYIPEFAEVAGDYDAPPPTTEQLALLVACDAMRAAASTVTNNSRACDSRGSEAVWDAAKDFAKTIADAHSENDDGSALLALALPIIEDFYVGKRGYNFRFTIYDSKFGTIPIKGTGSY